MCIKFYENYINKNIYLIMDKTYKCINTYNVKYMFFFTFLVIKRVKIQTNLNKCFRLKQWFKNYE